VASAANAAAAAVAAVNPQQSANAEFLAFKSDVQRCVQGLITSNQVRFGRWRIARLGFDDSILMCFVWWLLNKLHREHYQCDLFLIRSTFAQSAV
jgi:hypothetical protein